MSGFWRTALLAAAGLASGALAAEGIVRFAMPQSLRPLWDDSVEGVPAPRASVRGRHSMPRAFDVTVTFNAERFRSRRPTSSRPAPGTLRLAVLGDSFAFGWGVEDDEAFPARLEVLLGTIEVLNAGFPATSLGEKVAWYETWVSRFAPALVLLNVTSDDVDGDLYWRPFTLDARGAAQRTHAARPALERARSVRRSYKNVPGFQWLAERSQLFMLVRRAATRAVAGGSDPAQPASEEEWSRWESEGLALLRAEIERLADRVARDGARLAIVFIPFRPAVLGGADGRDEEMRVKTQRIVEALGPLCAARALRFADLTPALRERARVPGPPLYFKGDESHPTPEGHRFIASEIATFLRERSLLSHEPHERERVSDPR